MKHTKILQPTLAKIAALNTSQKYMLDVTNELLKNNQLQLQKQQKGFAGIVEITPFKGLTSGQLDNITLKPPVLITNDDTSYYLPKDSVHFFSQRFDSSKNVIELKGSITQLMSCAEESQMDNRYLRMVIPVAGRRTNLESLRGYHYECDAGGQDGILVELTISDQPFTLWQCRIEGQSYLIIDSAVSLRLIDFQQICADIFIAFGFLFGVFYGDEGYFLSSDSGSFENILDIFYSELRSTINSGMPAYTINPFSVLPVTATTEEEITRQAEEISRWQKDIPELEAEWFSGLCEMFYQHEPVSRAAMILIQADQLALEVQGSSYSVAMEAITAWYMDVKKVKAPKPLENDTIAKKVLASLVKIIDDEFPASDATTQKTNNILTSRLKHLLTNPTNADKLRTPFDHAGYTITADENKVVKHRDDYQHGRLPTDPNSDEKVFRDVYFSCMMLRRLTTILILKAAGFKGYIINYPQIRSNITRKDLGEERFLKI